MSIKFEWDEFKAKKNLRKHPVSFEIATRVFADPFALAIQDRIENGEHRWQTLGIVEGHLLLLVVHPVMEKGNTETVKIISARKAEPKKRRRYERNRSL